MRPLLILMTGSTLEPLQQSRGDFDRWFVQGAGLDPAGVQVVRAHEGERLPVADRLRGVIVTGSPAMVSQQLAWSELAAAWLAGVVRAGVVPVLGVCFGHQLLAHALGGGVGQNPRGTEMGTVQVRLTPSSSTDRLFAGLPSPLTVQATHSESVLALPPGAILLGHSALDPHQAFSVGRAAWGVQFHPEFDAEIVRGYINHRAAGLRAEGQDPQDLLARTADSPHGRALLGRFVGLLDLSM